MIGDGDLRLHYRAKKRKKMETMPAQAGRPGQAGVALSVKLLPWRGVILLIIYYNGMSIFVLFQIIFERGVPHLVG
jgi:hypothetical protein